nr:unnamed protein product [Spirometra erinaceieuropaei]
MHATIYETSCITATKAKREARESQLHLPRDVNAEAPPICQRCQRSFRVPVGLVGHLRTIGSTRTIPAAVATSTSGSPSTPTNDSDRTPEPPLLSSSSS